MSWIEERRADRQRRSQELRQLQQAVQHTRQQYRAEQLALRQNLRQQLRESSQKLAHDVANFLDQANRQRQVMAQVMDQSLDEFRSDLQVQVVTLRSSIRQQQQRVWSEQAQQRTRFVAHLKQRLWRERANASPASLATTMPVKSRSVARKMETASTLTVTDTVSPAVLNAPVPPTAIAPATVDHSSVDKVLQFVQQHPGSRLAQIETGVSLNRVETVNALQTLISASKVMLRNRAYVAVGGRD